MILSECAHACIGFGVLSWISAWDFPLFPFNRIVLALAYLLIPRDRRVVIHFPSIANLLVIQRLI